MNRHFIVLPLALGLALFVGCKKKESSAADGSTPSSPAAAALAASPPPFDGGRKTSFQEVTSQLDPGGSLYLYLATDQWLKGLSKKVSDLRGVLTSIARPAGQEAAQIERAFDLASSLIQRCGIEDITGVGLSAAPVAPGLYRNKMIVHHATGAGQGFLWSLFGKAPHSLGAQDLLPSTTALAVYGDFVVAQLWTTLQRELAQSGIPEVSQFAGAFPQMFQQQTGISWTELLASLDGEAGIILTLDPAKTVAIPMGPGGAIEIPTPGLVAAVKVKKDLLYEHISAMFKKNPQAVAREEGGLKSCSMDMPNPIGLPLQLTVASSGDYFFFATTSDLVRTVQAVRKGKEPGLKSTAEFKNLAKHVPAQGNQFVYLSARFGEAIAEIQKQAMAASGLGPQELGVLQSLFGGDKPNFSLSIGAHTANGWQTTSVGNQDSATAVLLAPAVGVAAMGAGLLLPALAKAKSRAQTINSVSNLKQLGLAARMYANDNKDKFPPADKWCDLLLAYAGSEKVYKAKNDDGAGRCSFAYNAKLSGMDEAKISPQTVLFFETESGWNVSGGQEVLLSQPRTPGTYVVGFADGSVQQVSSARMATLRWDP
jgi:hypothetical protein